MCKGYLSDTPKLPKNELVTSFATFQVPRGYFVVFREICQENKTPPTMAKNGGPFCETVVTLPEQTRFDTSASHGTESDETRQVLRENSMEIDRNMSSKMFIVGTRIVSPHAVLTKLSTR